MGRATLYRRRKAVLETEGCAVDLGVVMTHRGRPIEVPTFSRDACSLTFESPKVYNLCVVSIKMRRPKRGVPSLESRNKG